MIAAIFCWRSLSAPDECGRKPKSLDTIIPVIALSE
jgi:hypothetical protein